MSINQESLHIEIESMQPIPRKVRPVRAKSQARSSKYHLEKVTDKNTLFIANADINRVSAAAWQLKRKLGREFVCRTVEKLGVRGVRVWLKPVIKHKLSKR